MSEPDRRALLVWQEAKVQLGYQLPKATFNSLLSTATLVAVKGDEYTIGLPTGRAVEWVTNRLTGVIRQAITGAGGPDQIELTFSVSESTPPTRSIEQVEEDEVLTFRGFEFFLKEGFTKVPNELFQTVVPVEKPTVVALIFCVINQTIGHFVNFRTGETREWWEASPSEIAYTCGMSRSAAYNAIKEALTKGYIIEAQGRRFKKYRLNMQDPL